MYLHYLYHTTLFSSFCIFSCHASFHHVSLLCCQLCCVILKNIFLCYVQQQQHSLSMIACNDLVHILSLYLLLGNISCKIIKCTHGNFMIANNAFKYQNNLSQGKFLISHSIYCPSFLTEHEPGKIKYKQ